MKNVQLKLYSKNITILLFLNPLTLKSTYCKFKYKIKNVIKKFCYVTSVGGSLLYGLYMGTYIVVLDRVWLLASLPEQGI